MNTTSTHAERAAEEIQRYMGFLALSSVRAHSDQNRDYLTSIIARACQASVEEYREALFAVVAEADRETNPFIQARALLTRNTQQDTK